MPAKRAVRPPQRAGLSMTRGETAIEDIPKTLDGLARAVLDLQGRARDRSKVTTDLAVGANRINHNLGRVPSGATVTPTSADASFAWALTEKSRTQVVITTVGVVQTGATVELF